VSAGASRAEIQQHADKLKRANVRATAIAVLLIAVPLLAAALFTLHP
jgi:hypothetical protein